MVEIKKLRSNFEIRFKYNELLFNFLKSIPKEQCQAKMNSILLPDNRTKEDWYRLANEAGLAKIIKFCRENGIKFEFDNISATESAQIVDRLLQHNQKAFDAIKLKETEIDVTDINYDFLKIQPFVYQKQAVKFFEICDGNAILGDQPGVGKSFSAMAYAIKNNLKTLLIVPASLKLNWRAEILKFTHEKCYIYKFKPRKKDNIQTFTKDESLFHIINYESLESYFDFNYSHKCLNYNCKWEGITDVKKYEKCPNCGRIKVLKSKSHQFINKQDKDGEVLNPNDYDLIVMDEAHYIKNPTAFRSQIIKKAFKESSKKILMTGTAIKNRPYEFFPLLNLIDSKEWSNAHNFGVRYCNAHQDKFGHWNYDGYSNLEELYKRIAPYFLRRLKKDILKFLPPKTYTTIPIELKAKCSIEFINNIIEGDEKIVVFSQFISASEFIFEHFKDVAVWFTGKHNMIEKQEAVDKFMNDEKCKVFVGTIGAAGVGLTLTSASCLMFLDLPWEPASKIQAEDRIHRASQKADNIQIIKLICQNTIDVDIDNLITAKEQIISKVLDGEVIENKNEFSIFDDLLKIILDKKKK
jgi:SWI/SNF-related matrix-associated actin-dependent regulator 1 of chromatin subfamily A